MAQWPRSSSTRRTYQARSPGASRRVASRATSPRLPGDLERLGELAPPVEPGRLQRVEAVDLGPQRVGAVPARLDRLARPLAVDRDEGEERAAVGGEGAASADRLDDRRVGQLPGPAVHPAVARRRGAPAGRGRSRCSCWPRRGCPGSARRTRAARSPGRRGPGRRRSGPGRRRRGPRPPPSSASGAGGVSGCVWITAPPRRVDLLGDPLRGQRAVDEPGIDLRLDRPRDARRVRGGRRTGRAGSPGRGGRGTSACSAARRRPGTGPESASVT